MDLNRLLHRHQLSVMNVGRVTREQMIDGDVFVNRDDEPKNDPIGEFGGFMSQDMLRDETTRPAAEQFPEVKSIFRDAPASFAGTSLVPSIGGQAAE